jgi:hypothetical protein
MDSRQIIIVMSVMIDGVANIVEIGDSLTFSGRLPQLRTGAYRLSS